MALVRTSALISDIKGRMGGSVFQNSSNGLMLRTERSHVNRKTILQQQQRNGMVTLQNAWSALSDTDRQSWEVLAVACPIPTRKDATRFLSGQAYFLRSANAAMNLARVRGSAPPFLPTTAVITSAQPIVSITSIFLYNGGLFIYYDRALAHATEFYITALSRPLSKSQKSQYIKKVVMWEDQVDNNTQEITDYYTAAFGMLPVDGDFINCETTYFQFAANVLGYTTPQRIVVTTN